MVTQNITKISAMEILEDPKLQDDAMRELYDASLNGCVNTLNRLIQKDPLILSRVSLYPFTETPLHIASLLGHLKFCEALLQSSPNLATELDSQGRCPLHLASAKGHTEVVRVLLMTNPETCLVRDKDDMLPLHFAAMRGRVGAIKEFIKASPDFIREMISSDDDGSVLHFCVRYNHLDALKSIVESLRSDYQILSLKDKEDNTLLHLAMKRKQIKIIKYLLSLSGMSTEIKTLNREGLTGMDMFKRFSSDFMNQHILSEGIEKPANEVTVHEAVSSATLVKNNDQQTTWSTANTQPPTSSLSITIVIVQSDPHQTPAPSPTNNDPHQTPAPSHTNNDRHQTPVPSHTNNDPSQTPAPSHTNNDPPQTPPAPSLTNNDPEPASEPSLQQAQVQAPPTPPPPPASQINGPLPCAASQNMTASEQQRQDRWNRIERFCRTYLIDQGNWIDKKTREQLMVAATVIATMTFQSVISPPGGVWQGDTTQGGFTCPNFGFCEAGTAVVGYAWSPDFLKFVFFNSSSFFSSLCVMLVLMSGFPLENKVVMWILAVLMIVAASCMLLTYMWALGLVSPNHIYYKIRKLGYLLVGTWAMLLALVGLIQTSRIVFWARSRRKSSR